MADQTYVAIRYAADGHAGEAGDGAIIAQGTLDECREDIAARIGGTLDATRWDGLQEEGDIEAYHESFEEGCGGYVIRAIRVRMPDGWDYDYDAVVLLMDEEVREDLHMQGDAETPQEFVDAYCERHLAKYGEEFRVN